MFEELLISSEEIRRLSQEHPCPVCGRPCARIPSASNFAFKGPSGSDPTSGRSSSGSHDLDYPSLDKAIGRSANRKWKGHTERKEVRDKVRRETGSVAVSESRDGKVIPTDSATLKMRERGLKMFKKAREGA